MTEVTTTPTTTPTTGTDVDDVLDAILGRITSVADHKSNLKVMVYSDPGCRKSTFLGTANHSLIVDVEDGLTSLKNHPGIVDLSKVDVLPFKSFYQVESLINRMQIGAPQLTKYKTLSIDSMSELHKRGLAEVTEREFKGAPASRNLYVAETEDHTENNEHIRRMVSALRDLDRNIIITSHARTVQQKDKSVKIYPDFSEKLANTITGIMDVVAYVQKKEVEGKIVTIWWFESDGYVMAKNRIGLPNQLVDPTWETIWEYFEKHNAAQSNK